MAASSKSKIKVCQYCNRTFETVQYNQKYCCKTCYDEGQREIARLRGNITYQRNKCGTRKNKAVDNIAKKAKELGMSYGQYTALYGA